MTLQVLSAICVDGGVVQMCVCVCVCVYTSYDVEDVQLSFIVIYII